MKKNSAVLTGLFSALLLLSNQGFAATDNHFISVAGTSHDPNYNNDGAQGDGAIAIGVGASSISGDPFLVGNVAVGSMSTAEGSMNTAIGAFSKVSGYRNTALGYASWVNIEQDSSGIPAGGGVAVGDQSYVSTRNSVALGALSNAEVSRTGSVALFSGEKIEASGVVSIGHKKGDVDNSFPGGGFPAGQHETDLRRQIINVAGGVDDYDAVNIAQLKAVDSKISDIQTGMDTLSDKMEGQVKGVAALSAALSGLKPIQYDPMEPTQIMGSFGSYKGKQGVALGLAHYTREDLMLHGGVAFGSGEGYLLNVGLTYKFGHKRKDSVLDKYKAGPISSVYVMQSEIENLKNENKELERKINLLMSKMDVK